MATTGCGLVEQRQATHGAHPQHAAADELALLLLAERQRQCDAVFMRPQRLQRRLQRRHRRLAQCRHALAERAGQQWPILAHAKVHLPGAVDQRFFDRQPGDGVALQPVHGHQQAAKVVVVLAQRHGTQRGGGIGLVIDQHVGVEPAHVVLGDVITLHGHPAAVERWLAHKAVVHRAADDGARVGRRAQGVGQVGLAAGLKAHRGHHVHPLLTQCGQCVREAGQHHRLQPQAQGLGQMGQDLDLDARDFTVGGNHLVRPVVGQVEAHTQHRQLGQKSPFTRAQQIDRGQDQAGAWRLAEAVVRFGGLGCGQAGRQGWQHQQQQQQQQHLRPAQAARAWAPDQGRQGHRRGLRPVARAAGWPALPPSARSSSRTCGRGALPPCAR